MQEGINGSTALALRSHADVLRGCVQGTCCRPVLEEFRHNGTTHRAVLGDALRAGDPDEIAAMCRSVEQAMVEGTGGFSTGQDRRPGILRPTARWTMRRR